MTEQPPWGPREPADSAWPRQQAPPGWYLDPQGQQILRWWDGAQWSYHTQPLPAPRPPYPDAAHASSPPFQPLPGQDPFQPSQPQGWSDQEPGTRQQSYLPEPQPPARHGRRRPPKRKTRNALIGACTLIGIIVAIGLAAMHNPPSGKTAATAAASRTTAASVTAPSSCQDQAVSWKDNGGASHLNAMEADLTDVSNAAEAFVAAADPGDYSSNVVSALQSASASLQSDAQSAETDLPPACIPGMRGPYAQALTDYSKAAGDFQDAVTEMSGGMSSGGDAVAVGDVDAGNAAMSAGNGKIAAAATALTAFNNSQS